MFRNIFKFVAIAAGIVLVVWGAHGFYAYFYPLEIAFKSGNLLFGVVDMPRFIIKYVAWMSDKGVQSWFMPAVFIAVGIFLFWWQNRWSWR